MAEHIVQGIAEAEGLGKGIEAVEQLQHVVEVERVGCSVVQAAEQRIVVVRIAEQAFQRTLLSISADQVWSRMESECDSEFLIVVNRKNWLTRRRTRRALASVDHLKCHVGLVFLIRFLQP